MLLNAQIPEKRAMDVPARVYALIAAAGQSTRMGEQLPHKPLLSLAGKSVIARTVETFLAAPEIDRVVVLANPQDLSAVQALLAELSGASAKEITVLPGAESRSASVYAGLKAIARQEHVRPRPLDRLSEGASSPESMAGTADLPSRRVLVLIHDGARCLVSPALIAANVAILRRLRAGVAPFLLSSDTVRILGDNGHTRETPERSHVYATQTPQGADLDVLLAAYNVAARQKQNYTDDIAVLEAVGYPTCFYPGERRNIKLTYPEDLDLAEYYLSRSPQAGTQRSD